MACLDYDRNHMRDSNKCVDRCWESSRQHLCRYFTLESKIVNGERGLITLVIKDQALFKFLRYGWSGKNKQGVQA